MVVIEKKKKKKKKKKLTVLRWVEMNVSPFAFALHVVQMEMRICENPTLCTSEHFERL